MQSPLYRNRYRVPSARRLEWDYRWSGAYAVTICVRGRICLLGEVAEGHVTLSPWGEIVAQEWRRIPHIHPHVTLGDWIIMPDHLHGILLFAGAAGGTVEPSRLIAGSLGVVVGQFKQRSTKQIRARRQPDFAWQERYYDQILKDDDARERYRAYIRENPSQWQPPDPATPAP